MKGLIQRVSFARVHANGQFRGEISNGLVVFLAIEANDSVKAADKLLHKILNYRIFEDALGKMNISLLDCKGELVIVSQFTLAADTRKGLRPSFSSASDPHQGQALYNYFVDNARSQLPDTVTGIFGADMDIELCNRGPATFMLSVE